VHGREEYKEKNKRCKYIHAHGIQVIVPAAPFVLCRKKAGLDDKQAKCGEKFTVKMRDVIDEMSYKMPHRFFGLQVFLAADMTIFSINLCIAIKTVFLLALF